MRNDEPDTSNATAPASLKRRLQILWISGPDRAAHFHVLLDGELKPIIEAYLRKTYGFHQDDLNDSCRTRSRGC